MRKKYSPEHQCKEKIAMTMETCEEEEGECEEDQPLKEEQ